MVSYLFHSAFFPVVELVRLLGAESGQVQRNMLPVVLSCGFCTCLLTIVVLLLKIGWFHRRTSVFIWKRRAWWIPKGFSDPKVVGAVWQLCLEDAKQREVERLLHSRGLPAPLVPLVL